MAFSVRTVRPCARSIRPNIWMSAADCSAAKFDEQYRIAGGVNGVPVVYRLDVDGNIVRSVIDRIGEIQFSTNLPYLCKPSAQFVSLFNQIGIVFVKPSFRP